VDAADKATFAIQLAERGVCLVSNVPIESGQVLRFAESVGFVRETNYGRHFEVLAVPDPNNLAYTSLGLPLHTDNPYREPCPTVQLLHCLAAAPTGGASHFADGFSAAERMRADDPNGLETLATTLLQFRFHDSETDLRAVRPMIELDVTGAVTAVSVNHRSMEPPNTDSIDTARFYRAYQRFTELLREDQIEITLQPGELVAFDNRRVLHGRSGFDLTERRHLQGCYIDMDAIRSVADVSAAITGAQ
jgi:gamma-butyrobetaine dioxygenase